MMAQWDPFQGIEALRREIDKAFEDFGWRMEPFARTAFFPDRAPQRYPLINLYDSREALTIEALAPGVEPSSFDLTVMGKTLTIAGEKRPAPSDVKPEAFHRQERGAGRFTRTVELPVEVDDRGIRAAYTDGILVVTLPKAERATPRRIAVQVS